MKIIHITIVSLLVFLTSCSQYQNKKMRCSGEVIVYPSRVVAKDEIIGLRIQNDRIYVSGGTLQKVEGEKFCTQNATNIRSRDEAIFDTEECSDSHGQVQRTTGKYNYLTKILIISVWDKNIPDSFGLYQCE